jgi:hypothetical protein
MQWALASCERLAERFRPGWVAGFDLHSFGRFLPDSITLTAEEWEAAYPSLLSDPIMPFELDFSRSTPIPKERKQLSFKATHAGQVDGIVAWVWLALTPKISLDGQSGPGAGLWRRYWHPLVSPVRVQAGDAVSVMVEHTEAGLSGMITDPAEP